MKIIWKSRLLSVVLLRHTYTESVSLFLSCERRKSQMEICQSANIQQYKPKYHSNKQQYRNKIKDLSSFQFFYLAVVFCLFICWHSQTFLATTYNSYTLIFVSWLRLRNRIAYRCSQKRKGRAVVSALHLHWNLCSSQKKLFL